MSFCGAGALFWFAVGFGSLYVGCLVFDFWFCLLSLGDFVGFGFWILGVFRLLLCFGCLRVCGWCFGLFWWFGCFGIWVYLVVGLRRC